MSDLAQRWDNARPLVYLHITMPYHITLQRRTRMDTKLLKHDPPNDDCNQHTNQIRLAMMFATVTAAGREINTRLRSSVRQQLQMKRCLKQPNRRCYLEQSDDEQKTRTETQNSRVPLARYR